MEERALLAIIISIMIIVLYQYFFIPKPEIRKKELEKKEITTDRKEERIPFSEKEQESFNKLKEYQKKLKEKQITIETEKYVAKISNNGGRITSWKLKDYYKEKSYETWPLKGDFWRQVRDSYKGIFKKKDNEIEDKQIIDLIPDIEKDVKPPLDLKVLSEIDGIESFGEGIYSHDIVYFDSNSNDRRIKSIRMSFLDDKNIMIEKEMRFNEESYKVDLEIKIRNESKKNQKIDYAIFWGPGIGKEKNKGGHHRFIGPVIWINGKKTRIKPKKIKDTISKKGQIEWIAFENTYFAAAIIPENKESEAIIYKKEIDDNEIINIGLKHDKELFEPGEEIINKYELYIGPKRKEDLIGIANNFTEIIDYGWFSFLAKPLIWFLKKSYDYIPNYGINIIILTIIIKIIFWPLTEKSFGSMRDMQKIQPKMTELREKYKNDPAKMNKEIMDLYKKQGVNPLGGCLPMLLQIPVFFALYEGLLVAIEMKGAPFMLWIKDLSVMDPLLITPLLMGVTMYIQQKMMPTGMDPKQAKMMNLMPVLFTVFFLGFPSGLVIYWLLNNVLTIGHQYLIQRKTSVNA
ncbi:MAG: membrane protein insertase YidC [bacterium]